MKLLRPLIAVISLTSFATAAMLAADPTEFIACPVVQPPANKGTPPDQELIKNLIRCKKGEKAVGPGEEGAVKVQVTAIQIGTPRPWSYQQDSGNAQPGAMVYPIKATYNVSTLYRKATEVEEGWVRILNFYINAFGEWQIGSEEPVRPPNSKRIPKP